MINHLKLYIILCLISHQLISMQKMTQLSETDLHTLALVFNPQEYEKKLEERMVTPGTVIKITKKLLNTYDVPDDLHSFMKNLYTSNPTRYNQYVIPIMKLYYAKHRSNDIFSETELVKKEICKCLYQKKYQKIKKIEAEINSMQREIRQLNNDTKNLSEQYTKTTIPFYSGCLLVVTFGFTSIVATLASYTQQAT